MDEPDGSGAVRRWVQASVEGAADVTAVALGQLMGGPLGAVIAAPLPRLIIEGVEQLSVSSYGNALRRAGLVVQIAADRSGHQADEVLQAASHGARQVLAADTFQAAATTALPEKVIGLGRVLADGLFSDDDTVLDEMSLIAAALRDIENPHLRVLARFGESDIWETRWHVADGERVDLYCGAYDLQALVLHFPNYSLALDGVVATLERHGLIAELAVDLKRAFEEYSRMGLDYTNGQVKPQPRRWRITQLGLATLTYLDVTEDPDGGGVVAAP